MRQKCTTLQVIDMSVNTVVSAVCLQIDWCTDCTVSQLVFRNTTYTANLVEGFRIYQFHCETFTLKAADGTEYKKKRKEKNSGDTQTGFAGFPKQLMEPTLMHVGTRRILLM